MCRERPMDETTQIFTEVGCGNTAAVAEILRWKPELSRVRDPSSLSILQFARYMGRDAILDTLIEAGPPLDIFEAATIDRADAVRALLSHDPALATAYSADGFTAPHFPAHFRSTR